MGNIRLYIIIGVFVLLLVFLLGRSSANNRAERAKDSIREDAEALGLNMDDVEIDAEDLYTEFGFDGIFGIPWPWENETRIVKIVLNYDSQTFLILSRYFNAVYKKNLKNSLKKYLESDELADIGSIIL